MRVVVLADFAEPSGGAQAVAILSALALRARGVPVTYLHGIAQLCDERLAASGAQVIGLDLPDIWTRGAASAAVSGIWSREAAGRLGRALAGLLAGDSVLHLHQWTRSLSPSCFPVLLQAGRPLAVTLHDYSATCPNGVYYRFDQDLPCSLTPLSAGCLTAPCDPRSPLHKLVRVARAFTTRSVLAGAGFDVVHVSDRARDTLAPYLPATLRQHRIDNPVEAGPGAPAEIGPTSRIAYIGRLTREKGADLVAAAARAAGRSAMFIGEGPAESEVRRLDPEAELLGWRSRAEIERLLRGSIRAVAAPSRWYESGPLTVYEALAAGVPAVASARSGAAEKVVHGETGFVVEPEVEALASAFRTLADDRLATRLGQAAYRAYWADPPTPDVHAGRLISLYETMLGRLPAGRDDPSP